MQIKLLGILVDSKLNFKANKSNLYKKVSQKLNVLARLKTPLSKKTQFKNCSLIYRCLNQAIEITH